MPLKRSRKGELPTEQALVRAVQGGDTAAFGSLVERYLEPAYAIALSVLHDHHDAEDAVQSAFIRSLERIDHLQPGSLFGPWFYRVLRTSCLNLRRREMLRAHEPIPAAARGSSNPARDMERSVAREQVLDALEQLPEMQRMAVTLYDLEGYSHREVAEVLGIAVGTSRAHVHHARRALWKLLGPGLGPEEPKDEERAND
ncbi:MAG: RNA polymerase sigma factor [Gemmatimonadota bacterium]